MVEGKPDRYNQLDNNPLSEMDKYIIKRHDLRKKTKHPDSYELHYHDEMMTITLTNNHESTRLDIHLKKTQVNRTDGHRCDHTHNHERRPQEDRLHRCRWITLDASKKVKKMINLI